MLCEQLWARICGALLTNSGETSEEWPSFVYMQMQEGLSTKAGNFLGWLMTVLRRRQRDWKCRWHMYTYSIYMGSTRLWIEKSSGKEGTVITFLQVQHKSVVLDIHLVPGEPNWPKECWMAMYVTKMCANPRVAEWVTKTCAKQSGKAFVW